MPCVDERRTLIVQTASLLVSQERAVEHEVPDRKRDSRVDHLKVALHLEVEGEVACEELRAAGAGIYGRKTMGLVVGF